MILVFASLKKALNLQSNPEGVVSSRFMCIINIYTRGHNWTELEVDGHERTPHP
jgi:hypothetical protein